MRNFAPLIIIATLVVPPALAQSGTADHIIYEVKRGDTLIGLSQKYLVRDGDYRTVQRLNGVIDPNTIAVGTKLRINRSLLKYHPAAARVVSVRGNVMVSSGGTATAMVNGLSLGEGAMLRTSAASFASLQLDDGSRISLPSNSDVRISRLRKYVLGSIIDYDFDVTRGGLQSKVSKSKSANDRYQVRTPRAVSAVRGTDFQSRIGDANGLDFAEVIEGGLEVDTDAGEPMPIAAGSGLSVAEGGTVITETLLAPPIVEGAGKMQFRPTVSFSHPAGSAMRVSLAKDAGFIDTIAESVDADGQIEFANVEDGNYFARFKAISASGFEGLPQTYGFKRRLNAVSGSAEISGSGYSFKWNGEGRGTMRYHFQLHRGDTQSLPLVDDAGLTGRQIILSDLLPGDYYWRVASIQYLDSEISENWTEFEKLTVSAP